MVLLHYLIVDVSANEEIYMIFLYRSGILTSTMVTVTLQQSFKRLTKLTKVTPSVGYWKV